MPNILVSLFLVFAPLSIVTIGGGQSAIADIQRQVVDVHQWMTQSQFLDAFAISRMVPGPGALLVTILGWQIAGFWGAVVSTVALFGPTAILIYAVAHVWQRNEGAHWQRAIDAGLRPLAAGMIMSAIYVLLPSLDGGWVAYLTATGSTCALMSTRANPILLMAAAAGLFTTLRLVGMM